MSPARQAAWTGVSGLLVALLGIVAVPEGVAAQQDCRFGDTGLLRSEPDPRGTGQIGRVQRAHFLCARGVEIRSDSMVTYSADRLAIFYSSVRYVDGQRELRTDYGRYYYEAGRFEAQGNVVVTNYEDGSRVQNGDLVYLSQTDAREIEEMTFTTGRDGIRPHATVFPQRAPAAGDSTAVMDGDGVNAVAPDSTGLTDVADTMAVEPRDAVDLTDPAALRPSDTSAADAAGSEPVDSTTEPREPEAYEVTGDRLYFSGESYFDASGDVEIVRDSLFAYAQSAEYRGAIGTLLLERSARVLGSGYELVGRTIELASSDDGRDQVLAREDAVLNGDDLVVTAPRIVLHLFDGELERMVAVPLGEVEAADTGAVASARPADTDADAEAPPRPFAVSQDMELTADSLDMTASGGALERILAAGKARSVSSARDNMNVEGLPELARHDWMEGDTIEVILKPVAPGPDGAVSDEESGDTYEVDRIIARVAARSLYRLTPSDSTAVAGVDPPALSYIVANRITIFMLDGQADRVESVGQVTGWHLEPLSQPREPVEEGQSPDSTLAPTDPSAPIPTGLPPVGTDDRGDAAPPGT